METTVFKYDLDMDSHFTELEIPKGAKFIHTDIQYGIPRVWAQVNPEAPLEKRLLRFAGTGHILSASVIKHVGSFSMKNGAFVWHVFEVEKE